MSQLIEQPSTSTGTVTISTDEFANLLRYQKTLEDMFVVSEGYQNCVEVAIMTQNVLTLKVVDDKIKEFMSAKLLPDGKTYEKASIYKACQTVYRVVDIEPEVPDVVAESDIVPTNPDPFE